jgi:integrase
MASVRRKPGTRFYIACYTDSNGEQRQRSTKSMNRVMAQRLADQYEETYRAKLTEVQVRRVLSDIHKQLHGKPLDAMTLDEWAQHWLKRVKSELSAGTHDRYSDAWEVFKECAAEYDRREAEHNRHGDRILKKRMDEISTKHIINVRDVMAEKLAGSTVNTNFKPIKGMFRSAWIDGLTPDNPASRVQKVRNTDTGDGRRAFTLDELDAVLKAAKKADEEWHDLCLLAFYTGGQRLGDYARLRVANVAMSEKLLSFRSAKVNRQMIVPLVSTIAHVLEKRIKGKDRSAPIFPKLFKLLRGEGAGDVSRLSARFGRILYRAGLRENPSKAKAAVEGRRATQPLTFHSFRHTATSILKNRGVSSSVVQDIVGHDSEAVSENYTHIEEAVKRAALEKLPKLS